MKKLVEESINNARIALFKGSKNWEPTLIKDIPYHWAPFGAIEGDSAMRLDTGNPNDYCVYYKTPPGEFEAHVHINKEIGVVISGAISYKTHRDFTKVTCVSHGNGYQIEAGIWHSFKFLEPTLLFIQFHPAFESGSWEAKTEE